MAPAGQFRLAAALVGTMLLSSCAGLTDRAASLWPFGGSAENEIQADDGRIAVLTVDTGLTVDPALANVPVTLPTAQVLADWPMVGGVASNAPQHVEGSAGLSVLWKRKLGAGAGSRDALIASPVVADGKIFMFDTDLVVHAADANTGRALWRRPLARPSSGGGWFSRDPLPLAGGLGYDAGRLFATSGYGEVASMDANTGTIGWRTSTQTPIHASPTIAGGRLFVTTYDSELYAIDTASGAVSWTSAAISEPARMLTSPSPAVTGDTVISPFASGEVMANLAANGRRLWSEGLTRAGAATSLSTINDVAGRPVVVGGVVYAASQSGVLAAIDLRTGTRLWEQPVSSIQTPWVAGGFLFVVSVDAELICLDRNTGQVRWLSQLERYREPNRKKGRIAWTGPVLVGGQLMLASSEGDAITVSPSDGSVTNSTRLGGAVFVPPAVANGIVYFLTNEGEVIALR